VHQNFDHRLAKAASLPRMSEPVSQILTNVLHIGQTDFIWSGIGKCVVINRSYGYELRHSRYS